MKRLLPLLLAVLMLLAACSGDPAPTTTAAPPPTTAPETSAPAETEAPAFSPLTLLDTENCAFTVTNITLDDVWGYTFQVCCENRSDATLLFQLPEASCRGWFLIPDCTVMVSAGETKDTDFNIWPSDLERCGLDSLDELQLRLTVRNSDSFSAEPIADERFTLYPTGLSAQEIGPSPAHKEWDDEVIYAENGDFTFSICGRDENNIWTYNLTLYIENKSERALTFSWKDVSVNYVEADPWFYYTVPAGLKTCFNLYFNEDDMKAKEIDAIRSVDFTLVVTPADSFEELFREVYVYNAP